MNHRLVVLPVVMGSVLISCPAYAQQLVPPRQDTQSSNGVSYRSGSFNYSETDLSIGGDGDDGMRLERTYNSSLKNSTAFDATLGWTHSALSYVSTQRLPINPDDPKQPLPGREPYVYHITIGGRSIGFRGGSQVPSGGPVGAYAPLNPSGDMLVYTGTATSGAYSATGTDGTVVSYTAYPQSRLSSSTRPNGTRLDYTYSGNNIRGVISNRGFAILFESATKFCVVNLAYTYATATSTCPVDAQTVTYGYTASTYRPPTQLLTSVTKGGQTTTYTYGPADHLTCITEPGQSVCKIQNSYNICPPDPANPNFQPDVRLNDSVISQQDGAGTTYGYSYLQSNCPGGSPDLRPFISNTVTRTKNGNPDGSVETNAGSTPNSIVDALGRTTGIIYRVNTLWNLERVQVRTVTLPEGNSEEYFYDDRGNVITKQVHAKPGSGLADIVVTASYPATCVSPASCNKPDYVIDANGNRTDYTYDATHGGVLTETAPADANGIRAVKRYAYAQRYAWIKNASGGFSQAASPVWLPSEERSCRATATVGNACAGGAADEVIVAYDYGPNTGSVGNNLWLRGKTVTAQDSDGVIRSLRTCYGYDRDGNKIWETSPRAGLAACY